VVGVWWPWVVVWVVAFVALLLAVAILVVQWRDQKQRAQQPPYLSFYLHEQSVMDLYQYKYRGALEQEVESRLGTRGRVSAGTDVPMVRFGGSLERNREEFRKYLERAEPITVIGILMDVLSDDLVHIDLERNSIVPARNIDLRQRKIRLSELGGRTYVLARGVFHQNPGPSGEVTTFLAPYGDQASASGKGTVCQERPAQRRTRRAVVGAVPGHRPGMGPRKPISSSSTRSPSSSSACARGRWWPPRSCR
jgi:hypothetical protein